MTPNSCGCFLVVCSLKSTTNAESYLILAIELAISGFRWRFLQKTSSRAHFFCICWKNFSSERQHKQLSSFFHRFFTNYERQIVRNSLQSIRNPPPCFTIVCTHFGFERYESLYHPRLRFFEFLNSNLESHDQIIVIYFAPKCGGHRYLHILLQTEALFPIYNKIQLSVFFAT